MNEEQVKELQNLLEGYKEELSFLLENHAYKNDWTYAKLQTDRLKSICLVLDEYKENVNALTEMTEARDRNERMLYHVCKYRDSNIGSILLQYHPFSDKTKEYVDKTYQETYGRKHKNDQNFSNC